MKVAVGLRRVAAGKRTSGRRAAQIAGCPPICHTLGIKVSGDTVIRLLLKRYDSFPTPEAGDVIGVDDFAYKKRHTYGTIIVDGKTHEPVILLDGRNGDTLREWLKRK